MISAPNGSEQEMVEGDVQLPVPSPVVKQTGLIPLESVNRNDERVKSEHFNSSMNDMSIDLNKLDNFIPSNLKFDHNIQAQSLIHSQQQIMHQQNQHLNMINQNQNVPMGMPGYGVYQQGVPDFGMLSRSVGHGSKDLQVPLQPEHFPQQSLISQLSNHTIPHLSTFMPQVSIHSSVDVKEEAGPEIPFLEYSGGVVYDNGALSQGGRWLTFWQHRSRLWRKAFSVALYGYEGAKELAESFWISKMRAIQLYNRTKQHKLLLPDSSRRRTEQRSSRTKVKRIQLSPQLKYQTSVDIANTTEKANVANDDADVFWEEETQSWCFEKINKESNELEVARLSTEDADKNEMRSEAIKQKNAYYQDLLKEYGESRYPGLTYERTRCCWRVAHLVPSKGIKRNKYFNISRYGYKLAKELAVQYKETVDQLQGEEPTNWNGEIFPSQEFMNDPLTLHFHHILNSFRSRETKYKPDSIIGFSQVVNSVMDGDYYDTSY
ncbi:hypothetical protein BEWA_005350 [Theileria equi strain WA]|uniref:AP2/ERF domain-containing protein n=1 Tax=Theileria equi strain WA TaxID=1537102 RepID=L0AZU1_THEEQ|nr:hypothetical protein BEWA_005350 [Theileria equi strain WA]AFZ81127.1 hypothetical protein BEWA_005350 [Theileria equi strain WA]|eukprot:XP_004830793.1 hypothetical protein BEWA_005350 [Theileria equi strain WA]